MTTTEDLLARITLLSKEMTANEDENAHMQAEIDELYKRIDSAAKE